MTDKKVGKDNDIRKICSFCKGAGYDLENTERVCLKCDGSGRVGLLKVKK